MPPEYQFVYSNEEGFWHKDHMGYAGDCAYCHIEYNFSADVLTENCSSCHDSLPCDWCDYHENNKYGSCYACHEDCFTLAEFSFLKGFSILGKAILVWKTNSEINNEGFKILRSRDKRGPYEEIGFVRSRGDVTGGALYSFVDKDAPKGKVYYKVVDVDVEGKETSHDPVVVRVR